MYAREAKERGDESRATKAGQRKQDNENRATKIEQPSRAREENTPHV